MIDVKRSKLKQDLLILFLSNMDKEFYMRELERKTGHLVGNIQADMKNFMNEGLFTKRKDSNRIYYKINESFPYLDEIRRDLVAFSKPKQIFKSVPGFFEALKAVYVRPAKEKVPPYDFIIVGEKSRDDVEIKISKLKAWSKQHWRYSYFNMHDIGYSIIKADQNTSLVWEKN